MPKGSTSLLLFGAVGVGAYFFLAPSLPKDQSVNVVLGDAAPNVNEVTLRYDSAKGDTDWSRQVTLRFDSSAGAPRVVHHEARLPDGEYVIAIEARGAAGTAATAERRVDLRGGSSTSIDVSEAAMAALRPRAEGPR